MRALAVGLSLTLATALAGCAGSSAVDGPAAARSVDHDERGRAAYYSDAYQGKRTASGERYDRNDLTAAHRSLPFGTRVRVVNLENGNTVTVRINDRGPYTPGRIIDLSRQAAQRLGMIRSGVAPVRVSVVN